jgi:hypothetical protein
MMIDVRCSSRYRHSVITDDERDPTASATKLYRCVDGARLCDATTAERGHNAIHATDVHYPHAAIRHHHAARRRGSRECFHRPG